MPRVFNTPGVYRREIDLSEILIATGISNGAIVVRSSQGQIRRPVLVSNDKEYVEQFGQPVFTSGSGLSGIDKLIPEYGYGSYGALEFLKESTNLYVVRALIVVMCMQQWELVLLYLLMILILVEVLTH